MAIKGGELVLEESKVVEALSLINEYFQDKYNLPLKEVLEVVDSKESMPISVFKKTKLSSLEITVKYLKENINKKYSEIAKILNRDDRTIWVTYNNSLKKESAKLIVKPGAIAIPFSIFKDRKYSMLEHIVVYLKDKRKLSFKHISSLLNKDYQTIYTTYRRGISKNER